MTDLAPAPFTFDDSFARDLPELVQPWTAAVPPAPALLAIDEQVALELGVDPDWLRTPEGVQLLVGAAVPEGARPVAMAYAGHQFGSYSPRLGDGRALLLGEVLGVDGDRRDLHLKGSGRTPFARGGDGLAAVGPMLREYVMGVAMHALGIPTTRALAVVATGGDVVRETVLPGALLVRVARSHIRVGTFEYAAALGGEELLRRLADHTIARHHPSAADAPQPYLALLDAIAATQAELVAAWMHVGFVHGVMNTDNMAVSGETIDYGPCAMLDAYDPAAVFSSIDHGGRYAYARQPTMALWNLARLAEAMLPLFDDDPDDAAARATAVLERFPGELRARWLSGMAAKLGLVGSDDGAGDGGPGEVDAGIVASLLEMMADQGADMTLTMRSLSAAVRGDDGPLRAQLAGAAQLDDWSARWSARRTEIGRDPVTVAAEMDRRNPLYIARNHVVEQALDAATAGDVSEVDELVEVLRRPFEERPGLERYARPAPQGSGPHRTFCGT